MTESQPSAWGSLPSDNGGAILAGPPLVAQQPQQDYPMTGIQYPGTHGEHILYALVVYNPPLTVAPARNWLDKLSSVLILCLPTCFLLTSFGTSQLIHRLFVSPDGRFCISLIPDPICLPTSITRFSCSLLISLSLLLPPNLH